jgi:hypothetical protein
VVLSTETIVLLCSVVVDDVIIDIVFVADVNLTPAAVVEGDCIVTVVVKVVGIIDMLVLPPEVLTAASEAAAVVVVETLVVSLEPTSAAESEDLVCMATVLIASIAFTGATVVTSSGVLTT